MDRSSGNKDEENVEEEKWKTRPFLFGITQYQAFVLFAAWLGWVLYHEFRAFILI
jgi:hypothetical protein